MTPSEQPLPGVYVSSLVAAADERGRFSEVFRMTQVGVAFVQANLSSSRQGVLRGLHYHQSQADLWLLLEGDIQVGLADLRRRSERPPTAVVELRSDEPATLFIPPGIAHGFFARTDVRLFYLVSAEYDGSDEHGIFWDDASLNIPWDTSDPILSPRDRTNPRLVWDDIPAFS